MACEAYIAQMEAQKALKDLEDRLLSGELAVSNGLLGLEINGDRSMLTGAGLNDTCALAWIASHGSLDARLILEQAGANMDALRSIHAGGH